MKTIMKILVAIMLILHVVLVTECKPDDLPHDGGNSGTYNGHEYVDLGLPWGTLWATCNVGANTPEEFGDYFAWGETEPKATYDWNTYKYCEGDYNLLTKYVNKEMYCFNVDCLVYDTALYLLQEDDAATVNWGSGWCIPADSLWHELYRNTTHSWTTQNGVSGMLFVGSNGNSIFLPAAGWYLAEDLRSDGYYGFYWSSYNQGTHRASSYCFCSNYSKENYLCRYDGLSVRPVVPPRPVRSAQ